MVQKIDVQAFFRYTTISQHMRAGHTRFKFGCLLAWLISFFLTLPIFYYSDAVIVGDDNNAKDRVCKVTWISYYRLECIQLLSETVGQPICPHDQRFSSRCGFSQKPLEKVYLLFIIAVAVILPIGGTMIAYFGLIAKVEATDNYFLIVVECIRFFKLEPR